MNSARPDCLSTAPQPPTRGFIEGFLNRHAEFRTYFARPIEAVRRDNAMSADDPGETRKGVRLQSLDDLAAETAQSKKRKRVSINNTTLTSEEEALKVLAAGPPKRKKIAFVGLLGLTRSKNTLTSVKI